MLICHPNRRHTFSKQIKNPIKSNVICFFLKCNLHGFVAFAGRSHIWFFVCCWVMDPPRTIFYSVVLSCICHFRLSFVEIVAPDTATRQIRRITVTFIVTPLLKSWSFSLILFWKFYIYYKCFSAVFLIYVNWNFGRELERWISSKCIQYSLKPP